MQSTRRLPLFPLHTVLFPGVPLPIHVFEERYRLMVKRCLEDDRSFGVVLIRSGTEVGAPAVPFDVGTVARIIRVETRDDGSLDLSTVGERRFRIRSIVGSEPYAVADVEMLDDDSADASDQLVADVRRQFVEYVQFLRRLARRSEGNVRIPETALELSYLVAANLQVQRQEQQALLEDGGSRRLRRERDVLRRELAILQRLGAVTSRRVVTPSEFPLN